jgi:hypothetical protein
MLKPKTRTEPLADFVHNLVLLDAGLQRLGSIDALIEEKQTELVGIDAKLQAADEEAARRIAVGDEVKRQADEEAARIVAAAEETRRQADEVLAQAKVQAQQTIDEILKVAEAEEAAKLRLQVANEATAAADKVLADLEERVAKKSHELQVFEDSFRTLGARKNKLQSELNEVFKSFGR